MYIFSSQTLNLSFSSTSLLVNIIWFSQAVNLFLFCTWVHWYGFIDPTCMWYLRIFVFFWFTSLRWNWSVHPCCCQSNYFVLKLNSIPGKKRRQCSLRFSVNGRFGGFYVLAMVIVLRWTSRCTYHYLLWIWAQE